MRALTARSLLVLCLLAVVAALPACRAYKAPASREALKLLRESGADRRLKPPVPVGVPRVDLHEPEAYAQLCDRCHKAPAYDSQSGLLWGHRLSCMEGLTCLNCHHSPLHQQNLLEKKNYCMNCHVHKLKPTGCSACHDAKRLDLLNPHPKDYNDNHSKLTKQEQKSCDRCHGSLAWCNTCHGK